jgi:hypothetical protein
MRNTLRAAALLMVVSGCSGSDRVDPFGPFKWPSGDREKERPQQGINMAGRWTLTSPNRGQCGMNFSGGVKVTEGTIAPEGGCPGNFYTSRRWALEEGNVIIRDHNGAQLAQLAPAGAAAMWFEGQAASGERIMLARQ